MDSHGGGVKNEIEPKLKRLGFGVGSLKKGLNVQAGC